MVTLGQCHRLTLRCHHYRHRPMGPYYLEPNVDDDVHLVDHRDEDVHQVEDLEREVVVVEVDGRVVVGRKWDGVVQVVVEQLRESLRALGGVEVEVVDEVAQVTEGVVHEVLVHGVVHPVAKVVVDEVKVKLCEVVGLDRALQEVVDCLVLQVAVQGLLVTDDFDQGVVVFDMD